MVPNLTKRHNERRKNKPQSNTWKKCLSLQYRLPYTAYNFTKNGYFLSDFICLWEIRKIYFLFLQNPVSLKQKSEKYLLLFVQFYCAHQKSLST